MHEHATVLVAETSFCWIDIESDVSRYQGTEEDEGSFDGDTNMEAPPAINV